MSLGEHSQLGASSSSCLYKNTAYLSSFYICACGPHRSRPASAGAKQPNRKNNRAAFCAFGLNSPNKQTPACPPLWGIRGRPDLCSPRHPSYSACASSGSALTQHAVRIVVFNADIRTLALVQVHIVLLLQLTCCNEQPRSSEASSSVSLDHRRRGECLHPTRCRDP